MNTISVKVKNFISAFIGACCWSVLTLVRNKSLYTENKTVRSSSKQERLTPSKKKHILPRSATCHCRAMIKCTADLKVITFS